MGFIHERRYIHEIVIPEAVGVSPFAAFLVTPAPGYGDIEHRPFIRFIAPDGRFDAPVAEGLNWTIAVGGLGGLRPRICTLHKHLLSGL